MLKDNDLRLYSSLRGFRGIWRKFVYADSKKRVREKTRRILNVNKKRKCIFRDLQIDSKLLMLDIYLDIDDE